MAIKFGTFNFSANLNVKKDAALDPRLVVESKADLTKLETWNDGDGKAWLYNGMVVAVPSENKLYMLTNFDMATAPDAYQTESNWVAVDASAAKLNVINNLTSSSTTEPLAAAQGKELKSLVDAANANIESLKTTVSGVMHYKGSVTSYDQLPVEDNTIGDVWNVDEPYNDNLEYSNYAWNGSDWDCLGGSIDMSYYYTSELVDKNIEKAVAPLATSESVTALEGKVTTNTNSISTIEGKLAVVQGSDTTEGSIKKALADAKAYTDSGLSDKVDKVEGSSLITAEKLALIDTNASGIADNTSAINILKGGADVEGSIDNKINSALDWINV